MAGTFGRLKSWAGTAGRIAVGVLGALAQSMVEKGQARCAYPLAMYALGWPPPLRYFGAHERAYIAQRYEAAKGDPEALAAVGDWVRERVVARHDARHLRSMLREWGRKPWLRKRMPILREAVEAHIQRRYLLSVPPILAQLEGIVAEGFAHRGRLSHRDRTGKNPKTLEEYLRRLLPADESDTSDQAVRDLMLDVVLGNFEHGVPLPGNVNRHAILHGADTDYGMIEYSLKAILLFDYLQDAFEFVASEGGRAYHLPGCRALGRARKDRVVFRSEAEASEGRRPCRTCLPDRWEPDEEGELAG